MSRFLSHAAGFIKPYVPGEQPRDKRYIKLNTNECPYPPSPKVTAAINATPGDLLRLYPDPDSLALREAIGAACSLPADQVLACGGSDEALAYAFMAFFDKGDDVYYPDITYGFYKVYANLFGLRGTEIPLTDYYRVDTADYTADDGHIFIANPNAPTGICLETQEIEKILGANPNHLVVVDEAYADFATGKTALPLLAEYDNLLIIRTLSKSRSLAGMRVGFALGSKEVIDEMNRVRYSFNPYNISRLSMIAGIEAMGDTVYFRDTVEKIVKTREAAKDTLRGMGFTVLDSSANFLFAAHPGIGGRELYSGLKDAGILVRHFEQAGIDNFVRISIGTDEEMNALYEVLRRII